MSIRSLLYEVITIPPTVNETFGAGNFYNFGRMCFGYEFMNPITGKIQAFFGRSLWLDQVSGRLVPELPNATWVNILVKPGVLANFYLDGSPGPGGIGCLVNGQQTSFLNGQATNMH